MAGFGLQQHMQIFTPSSCRFKHVIIQITKIYCLPPPLLYACMYVCDEGIGSLPSVTLLHIIIYHTLAILDVNITNSILSIFEYSVHLKNGIHNTLAIDLITILPCAN